MRRTATLSLALLLSACPSDGDSDPTIEPATARLNCELYTQNCFGCHGVDAHGHGPHGMHLDPPPSDLRAPDSQTMEHATLLSWVRDGVPGTDMPAFVDILTEQEMRATLEHVNALEAGTAVTCDAVAGSESGAGGQSTGGTGDATSGAAGDTTTEPDPGTTGQATADSGTDSPDSAGSSDGSTETTGGSVSPECEAWCGCLEAACSDVPGYPIPSVEACHAECASRTAEEIACWQGFCDSVADSPALADHNCEHAWGGLGLAEC